MAQLVQICDVKPNLVTVPHCKNTIDVQHLKNGTEYVRACALQLEGNWQKHGTYIELLESTDFKVSGECQLRAGEDPYVGHFVVGLAKHHSMGKVKTEKSPPYEESEEDFTCHLPGIMTPIARGGKMWFWFGFGSYKMYLVWIDEPKPFSNHILINVVMVLV
ncbi:hypothetical protein ACET3Z_020602 [Daucus carota]|nr:PREDICTED: uncharacterized protein LOC108221875 [Daucus carota subsp. sativus]